MSDRSPPPKKAKVGGSWMEKEFELDPYLFTYGSGSDDDSDRNDVSAKAHLSSESDEASNKGYEASSENENSNQQTVPSSGSSTAEDTAPRKLVLPGPHNNYQFKPLPGWFYEDGPTPPGVLDDVFDDDVLTIGVH